MPPIQLPDNSSSFLVRSVQLYGDMLNDVKLCKRKGLGVLEEIQCCFEIATNYAGELGKQICGYVFESPDDEVIFFKKIKPLFTSEADYYACCYHAELFKDSITDDSRNELEVFYRRQLQRRNKFSREHSEFYNYMEQDGKDKDHEWFRRLDEEDYGCPFDKPMASYLALKRYEQFIEDALKAIGADPALSENKEENL